MRALIEGIHRFQSGVFGAQAELFKRLVDKQEPDALFITCSDSRISPNLITQTQPGDLFILRNAGNLVPPWGIYGAEAATIEYAVEALGVADIIVCGHTHCGAMHGLVEPDKVKDLPAVSRWLEHAEGTRRVLKQSYGHLEGEALLETAAEENALAQIENLRTHPAVMAKLAVGKLTLHAWLYDIVDGSVHAFDGDKGQFVPVAQAGKGVVERKDRIGAIKEI